MTTVRNRFNLHTLIHIPLLPQVAQFRSRSMRSWRQILALQMAAFQLGRRVHQIKKLSFVQISDVKIEASLFFIFDIVKRNLLSCETLVSLNLLDFQNTHQKSSVLEGDDELQAFGTILIYINFL